MASIDRRERERLETREKIMTAARDLFALHGYESVSLRKIAEAIEYTPAAIYVHFADKEALFRELASQDFRALAKAFSKIAEMPDPLARVAAVGQAYIEFGLQHPNHYRLMFMTTPTGPRAGTLSPEEMAHKGNPAEDGYAFLRVCVAEAIDKGLVREELSDPDLVAQTFWAGVHGVASLEITMCKAPWIDWQPISQRIATMVWTSIRGAARDPSRYPTPAQTQKAVGKKVKP